MMIYYLQNAIDINLHNQYVAQISKKITKDRTFKGIYTVDTTAYYPEDRGISESIKFGRNLVKQILKNSYLN